MKLIKMSLVAALLVGSSAFAGEYKDSGLEVSANMAITSNYIWRGMTQSANSPAIQGGIDLGYKGFYLGTWGSNVNFGNKSSMEADIYAGYAGEYSGIGYDIGAIQFAYPNEVDSSNFAEVYYGLSYDFEVVAVGATYYMGVSTNDFEPDDAWEVSASAPLPGDFSIDVTYGDYDSFGTYYLVGLNKSYGKFDFTLAYTANDSTDEDNIVVTVGTSF